jgi:hypothetical protein
MMFMKMPGPQGATTDDYHKSSRLKRNPAALHAEKRRRRMEFSKHRIYLDIKILFLTFPLWKQDRIYGWCSGKRQKRWNGWIGTAFAKPG